MNDKKICFIICSNQGQYEQECLHYIQHLNVPDGYEIDALVIHDAKSLTSAYNEGMHASDAKYKVYLHQDTFIVNSDFIYDILDLFSERTIGMIGIIGSPKLPSHAIMWYGKRVGTIQDCSVFQSAVTRHEFGNETKTDKRYVDVEAIDGFLMVTQYDLPWREDLFGGWDFYDVSQSMEFIRHGYRVVVPVIKEPWTIHDCGFVSFSDYYKYRDVFVKEYGPF